MSGLISTKGQYALRAMADLAMHSGWVSLGDVSKRQRISRKYLEQVIALMHKAGYVESMRGKGGGYKLTRDPEQYTLGQILRAAEGSLAPVPCLDCRRDNICPNVETCPTISVWRDLGKVTAEFLDSRTLADILHTHHNGYFGDPERDANAAVGTPDKVAERAVSAPGSTAGNCW